MAVSVAVIVYGYVFPRTLQISFKNWWRWVMEEESIGVDHPEWQRLRKYIFFPDTEENIWTSLWDVEEGVDGRFHKLYDGTAMEESCYIGIKLAEYCHGKEIKISEMVCGPNQRQIDEFNRMMGEFEPSPDDSKASQKNSSKWVSNLNELLGPPTTHLIWRTT